MGRSQRPGSQLQRPKRAVKSLTNRYLLAPEQASSTTLRAYRAGGRARRSPRVKPRTRFQRDSQLGPAPPRPTGACASRGLGLQVFRGRRAGREREGLVRAGSICSLGYCLPVGSCPLFSRAGRQRVARAYCSVCTSGRARVHPFATTDELSCCSRRSLCAHAPLGATAETTVCLPTATYTPFLREGVDL